MSEQLENQPADSPPPVNEFPSYEEYLAETASAAPADQEAGQPPALVPPTEQAKTSEPAPGGAQAAYLLRAQSRLARKERELNEREKALKQETRPKETKWDKAAIARDPIEFMKAQGLDPGTIARAMLAKELGESAPEAYHKMAEGLQQESARVLEIEELKAKIAELKSSVDQRNQVSEHQSIRQQYFNKVEASLSGDLTALPVVATMVAKDKSRVLQEVAMVVAQDAQAKLASGRNAPPMTPEEALAELNRRYEWVMGNKAPEAAPAKPARPTLGNSQPYQPKPKGEWTIEDSIKEAEDYFAAQHGINFKK